MSPFLEQQIDALLEDSRWDIAYLGMQIVIESLALAAFGDMLRRIEEPLLRKLLRYVMSDEARHVAFGVLSLQELYRGLTEAELKDRQEFLVENTLRSRARSTTPEVWERMGVDVDDVRPFLLEAAGEAEPRAVHAASRARSSPSSCPTCASSACSTPTTATCASSGARPGCSSSSSPTTPAPTTRAYDEVAADRAAVERRP